MSNQTVIQLLKEAYTAELETTINYLSHGVRLETFDGHDIAEELLQDVTTEQNHAQRLGERLKILDSEPPTSFDVSEYFTQASLNSIEDATDVESVITGVIEAEKSAIQTYRELIEEARDANDYATARLAEELLQDEEKHLQEFKEVHAEFSD